MSAPIRAGMRPTRPVDDVSELPDVAFGSHDLAWWGTLGFVVIEGFTLTLCAVVLVYLRQNFHQWPPEGVLLPSLGWPTINVAVMLASLPVVFWMQRRAKAFDLNGVRLGTLVATLFGVAFVALRMLELTRSLHIKWDANAYGSAQWLVLGTHGTLLLFELVEMAGIMVVFLMGRVEGKHFSDAADAAFYWYFMVLAWLPLYALCYWLPRWA
jgi:cytochrome c oxidase subunit III